MGLESPKSDTSSARTVTGRAESKTMQKTICPRAACLRYSLVNQNGFYQQNGDFLMDAWVVTFRCNTLWISLGIQQFAMKNGDNSPFVDYSLEVIIFPRHVKRCVKLWFKLRESLDASVKRPSLSLRTVNHPGF